MDNRVRPGDTIRLDDDKWDHHNQDYYVHLVEYRKDSTATELTLEDAHGNIFKTVVASHQIVKVI